MKKTNARKINEIFPSIQGEGCRAGVPSVFIRFSGCNLNCWFCDTPHESGQMLSDDEIIAKVKSFKGAQIVLTGGEPSLFVDKMFIERLKLETGLPVAIETNGTHQIPDNIDWVTISPKRDSEGNIVLIKAERADELKVVEEGQPLDEYFSLPCVGKSTIMLLQPCDVNDPEERQKNTRRCLRRVLEDPRWRLSLQTHKYMGIR